MTVPENATTDDDVDEDIDTGVDEVPVGRADLKGRRSRLLEIVYPTERNLAEFNRTALALMAMNWLLEGEKGNYEAFTACQKGPHKLTKETFAWLVEFARKTFGKPDNPNEIDPTAVAAMEVFLVIHDLGKALARPGDLRDHDEILRDFLERNAEKLQTFHELDERRKKYILDGLKLNIAQFVQGESTPASLERIADTDLAGFNFNAVHIVCDIAGAAGNVTQNGSLTMNEPTARKFQHAIESLQQYFDGKTLDEVTDEYHSRIVDEFGLAELTDDPALLKLITRSFLSLRRVDVEQARVDLAAFRRLPEPVRSDLLREYSIRGTTDGTAILVYMSPAMLINIDKNLPGGEGVERGFRVLHRVYQQGRENLGDRSDNGCFTIMIHDLADAALEDPDSLPGEFHLNAEGLNGEIIQPGRRKRPGKLPVTAPPESLGSQPVTEPVPVDASLLRSADDGRDDPRTSTGYVTEIARRNPELFLLAAPEVRATPEGFGKKRPDTIGDRIFPSAATEDVWYRDLLVVLTNDPKARYLAEKIVTHLKTGSDPASGQGVLTGVARNRFFSVPLDEFAADTVAELADSWEASRGSLNPWYDTGAVWPNVHFVVAREELGDVRLVLHEVDRLSPAHARKRYEGAFGIRTCVFSPYATAAEYDGFPGGTRGFGLIGAARNLRDLDPDLLLRQFHAHAVPLNMDSDTPGDYFPIVDWNGVGELYRTDLPGRDELGQLLGSLAPPESVVEFVPRYSEGDPTSLVVDPGSATTSGLLGILALGQEHSMAADRVVAVPVTVDFASGQTVPANRRDRAIREQLAVMMARNHERPGAVTVVTGDELRRLVTAARASPSPTNVMNQLRLPFATGHVRSGLVLSATRAGAASPGL